MLCSWRLLRWRCTGCWRPLALVEIAVLFNIRGAAQSRNASSVWWRNREFEMRLRISLVRRPHSRPGMCQCTPDPSTRALGLPRVGQSRSRGKELRQDSYLKYILPLLPTLATVNWRPSLPAEPPSGAMSHLSASASLVALGRALSSCSLRSVSGTRGRAEVVLRKDLDAVLVVVVASLPVIVVVLGEVRLYLGSPRERLGDAGFRRGLVDVVMCAAAGGSVEACVSTSSIAKQASLAHGRVELTLPTEQRVAPMGHIELI